VTLPFVLGAECAGAVVDGEGADEGARVGGLDVFAVFGGGLEGFGGVGGASCRCVCCGGDGSGSLGDFVSSIGGAGRCAFRGWRRGREAVSLRRSAPAALGRGR